MAGADMATHAWEAWTEWGIQALVLLSLTLQVTLLVLAEFRRRVDSGVVSFFAWSAYMLADGTALYVLGHLSAAGRSTKHELMTFWAPFLLVHLGGQDNITTYDPSGLWLRHLQTLAVQVATAGYVVYASSIVGRGGHSLLLWACIVMFLVGVVKYGERVWALRRGGGSSLISNYQPLQHSSRIRELLSNVERILEKRPWDREDCLLMAHLALGVPKELMTGLMDQNSYRHVSYLLDEGRLYKVAELQLSLMHDVFYTKAEVMHSWHGLCIHVLSPVATAIALLLFHLHRYSAGRHTYSRADVAVTYVLLVGTLALEVVSAFRAVLSSWTCVLILSMDSRVWFFLGRVVLFLRRLVHAADWARYWSGSMGQHNLLLLAAGSRASKRSKVANWIGREVWWNAMAYSWSIPVPVSIQELVVEHILSKVGVRRNRPSSSYFDSRGQDVLQTLGLYSAGLAWSVEENILVWHIATNIYMSCYWRRQQQQQDDHRRQSDAAEALSNYMMYLLASRPHMLGLTASRNSYVEVCYALVRECPSDKKVPYSSAEEVASFLKRYGDEEEDLRWGRLDVDHETKHHLVVILGTGCELGSNLVRIGGSTLELEYAAVNPLELIAQVWVETLCYASQLCTADSHAKELSNGGELITVAAVLVQYFRGATREHDEMRKKMYERERQERERERYMMHEQENMTSPDESV